MPKNDEITTKFKVDISDLKSGISEANQQIKLANAEFKAATAGMDDWAKSADGIRAKLGQLESVLSAQKSKLEAYNTELERQKDAYDENGKRAAELRATLEDLTKNGVSKTSDEYKKYENALAACEAEQEKNKKAVDRLSITVLDQQAAVGKTQAEIGRYNTSLDTLEKESGEADKSTQELDKAVDDAGKTAEEAGGKFDGLGKKIAAGVAAGMAALGALAVETGKKIWQMSNEVAEAGDRIDKQSQKVGLSYESYQKWDYAMQLAGTSMSNCTTGLKTLTNTFDDALQGSDGAITKFDRLGISLDDLKGKSREDIFGTVVEALQNVADDTERAALANDMFGKSGQDLLPLLNQSSVETRALLQEAEDYGMVMSDDAVKASAEFEDSLTRLKGTMGGIKNSMTGDILPSLTTLLDGFTDLAAGVDGGGEKIKDGVSGILESVETMIPQIVSFVTRIAEAVLEAAPEIIKGLATGITEAIPQILPALTSAITSIAEMLVELAPELITVGVEILLALIDGFTQAIPTLAEKVVEVVPTVVTALVGAIPDLLKGAIEFFLAIVQAIPEIIPALIEALPEIITAISEALVEGIPMLIEGSIQLLMAIIDAIPVIVTALTENLPQIIEAIVTTLVDNIPVLLEGAVTLFMALVEAIPVIVEELIKALPQIVDALMEFLTGPALDLFVELWEGIKAVFKNLGQWFSIKFKNAWEGIQAAWSAVGQWFADLWESIKEVFSGIGDWFGEKFDAAWQTIKGAWSGVERWFSDLWEGIKEIFSGVGDWFGETFEKVGSAIKAPLNAVIRAMNTVIDGLNTISIDVPDWVPLLGGKTFGFNLGKIPELAQGGVLGRGQTGFLEGNGAEAVVPLDQNKFWIREVVEEMIGQMKAAEAAGEITSIGGSRDYNFTQIINAPQAPSRIEIYRQTRNLLSYARATAAGGV